MQYIFSRSFSQSLSLWYTTYLFHLCDFNFLRRGYRAAVKKTYKKRLRGSIIPSSSRMVILRSGRVGARSENGQFLAHEALCFALRIAKRASCRPLWINFVARVGTRNADSATAPQVAVRLRHSLRWRSYNWEKFSTYKINVI